MAFPSSLPSYAGFISTHTLSQDNHASQHNSEQTDIIAIATKLGTGASTASNNTVLRGNGAGTTSFDTVKLDTDVANVLSTDHGGTGSSSAATGTGGVVLANSPSITTPSVSGGTFSSNPNFTGKPTITDFTNAQHNHQNAAGGGTLSTNAFQNATVTADKLATGAASAFVSTNEGDTTTSYHQLTTKTDVVTVTIGANGVALVVISANMSQATAGTNTYLAFDVSGANTIAANDNASIEFNAPANNSGFGLSGAFLLTGLTAGSTTFGLRYRVQGGSANGAWNNRRIGVVPL